MPNDYVYSLVAMTAVPNIIYIVALCVCGCVCVQVEKSIMCLGTEATSIPVSILHLKPLIVNEPLNAVCEACVCLWPYNCCINLIDLGSIQ